MSVHNWITAVSYLEGGRSKTSRPIENNTRVERRGDDVAIRLHDTDVVTYHADGSITLDSGGWLTVTTKDRMNKFMPAGLQIGSDRGRWFVYRGWQTKVCRYFDGITFAADGTVLNPQPEAKEQRQAEAETKMSRRIDRYLDGFMAALDAGMPMPSGGDCWDCAFVTTDGKSMGDLKDDQIHGHLFSHMTERYYVPTLLYNAVKERGYGDPRFVMGIRLDRDALEAGQMKTQHAWGSTEPDPHVRKEFRHDLRKYLRKRLIPTVVTA